MAAAGCNNETPYEAMVASSPLQKRNVSSQKVGGVDLRNIEERSVHSVLRDELDIDDETTVHTEVSDLETMIDTHRDNIEKDSSLICCLLYTSPSPRDGLLSRMPSSA